MGVALYLLQHGDAVSREEDEQRPLSNIGRQDIERLAKHLAERNVRIDNMVHSGKLRAEQSAQIIADVMGAGVTPVAYRGIGPNDDPGAFIDDLDTNMSSILLAGHMPFVSKLCSVLLTGSPGTTFAFTPGSMACLKFEDGSWGMVFMLRPDIL